MKTNIELCSVSAERVAHLVRPCLPFLDFVIIDDFEAGAVAGTETIHDGMVDPAACTKAAKGILASGAAELVIVHFPAGCVAVTRDGQVVGKPSVRVPQDAIAGTNGAGDAFAAGVLFAVHENWPLDEALTLAHACAAASLRSITTTGAVVDWRECLALAALWGWREPEAIV
jgi:sugar/nucleoside kinase (ribokinase family)